MVELFKRQVYLDNFAPKIVLIEINRSYSPESINLWQENSNSPFSSNFCGDSFLLSFVPGQM